MTMVEPAGAENKAPVNRKKNAKNAKSKFKNFNLDMDDVRK